MHRLAMMITVIMLVCSHADSFNPLHANMAAAAAKGSLTERDIKASIERYGKRSLIDFILAKNNGRITVQVGNQTKLAYGSPNSDYITVYTIQRDLSRCGITIKELNNALASAQQARTAQTTITKAAQTVVAHRPWEKLGPGMERHQVAEKRDLYIAGIEFDECVKRINMMPGGKAITWDQGSVLSVMVGKHFATCDREFRTFTVDYRD